MAKEAVPSVQIERIKQIDRIKPTLFLTEKDCPEIKNMEAGQEYDFIIHAKMTSSTNDLKHPDTGHTLKKPIVSGRFEILSIESPGEVEPLNEEDFTQQKLRRLEEKAKE